MPARAYALTLSIVGLLAAAAPPASAQTAAQPAPADLPGKGLAQHDFLYCGEWQARGKAGNTLINNWSGSLPLEQWPTVVQLIEVTPDKKVVWALRDWTTLGPASATQLLDEPGKPERLGISSGNPLLRELFLAQRGERVSCKRAPCGDV